MIGKRFLLLLLALAVATVATVATVVAAAEEAPRMSREELKAMLDNPDLVIVDVRRGKDWDASEFKVKGAMRMDPDQFESWKGQLPKDKTLVLYCA